MRIAVLSAAAVFTAAAVLVADPPAAKTGQMERALPKGKYVAYVGSKYAADRKANVLICLHADSHDPEKYVNYYKATVDTRGWVYLMPKAPGGSWTLSDDKFILSMVDDFKKDYNVDDTRMLITGYSDSGPTAAATAFGNPKRFAALVLLAANKPDLSDKDLAAGKSIALFVAHGGKDQYAPFAGAKDFVESARKAGLKVEFVEKPDVDSRMEVAQPPVIVGWYEGLPNPEIEAWYNEARKLVGQDKFADAVALYRKVIAAGPDLPLGKKAKEELDLIDQGGQSILKHAQEELGKQNYDGAARLFGEVAKRYAGTPSAEEATKQLAALKSDPKIKEAIERRAQEEKEKGAEREYAAAEAKEKAKEYEAALAGYHAVVANYAGTSFEEKAKVRVKALTEDPAVQKAIADAKSSGEVKALLLKAENYRKNKMYEKAIEVFKNIEQRWPGTPQAEDAKKKRQECERAMK
ncbi:MAG: tetratricopeptide repeat protein [Planctomycetes bacterium]|nr:tetratricopeptide repeat protein [Planctomycetota bacterium]